MLNHRHGCNITPTPPQVVRQSEFPKFNASIFSTTKIMPIWNHQFVSTLDVAINSKPLSKTSCLYTFSSQLADSFIPYALSPSIQSTIASAPPHWSPPHSTSTLDSAVISIIVSCHLVLVVPTIDFAINFSILKNWMKIQLQIKAARRNPFVWCCFQIAIMDGFIAEKSFVA